MSSRALIIACLLLAVLATGVWLAGRRTPAGPTFRVLLPSPIDESTLAKLTVSSGGADAAITRGSLPGLWTMTAAPSPAAWPANPARIRAALKVLSQAQGAPITRATGPSATVVRISATTGESVTLTLSEPLGGKGAVTVTPASGAEYTVLVGEDLLRLFRAESMAEWRSPAAFPQSPGAASRISLGGATPLRLSRSKGQWSLSSPIALAADPDAVGRLLAALERVTITKTTRAEGPPNPPAITIETDVRQIEGDAPTSSVIVQELRLAGSTDGAEVRATITAHLVPFRGQPELLWGPLDVMLDSAALREITLDPSAYLSRVAARNPPADVGSIVLGARDRTRTLRRDLETWASDTGSRLSDEEAARVAAALAWLCTTPADSVELLPAEPPPSGLAITLRSLDGGVLRTLRAEAISDASGKVLVRVHDGGAAWYYQSPAAATLLEWLDARL